MPAPYRYNVDERMQDIINMIADGKSKTEVAIALGYRTTRTLYAYSRRHGYVWDNKVGNYVKTEKKPKTEPLNEAINRPTSRVGSILEMFEHGMDAREIARRQRFGSVLEMADFMRNNGYTWNNDVNRYVFVPPTKPSDKKDQSEEDAVNFSKGFISEFYHKYNEVLNLLVANKDKLELILNAQINEENIIPRYVIPGALVTKSLHLPNGLNMMCTEFSESKNVSQKDIVQVALVDFFNRYGFREKVSRLLRTQ